jgi:hypothetical protein
MKPFGTVLPALNAITLVPLSAALPPPNQSGAPWGPTQKTLPVIVHGETVPASKSPLVKKAACADVLANAASANAVEMAFLIISPWRPDGRKTIVRLRRDAVISPK